MDYVDTEPEAEIYNRILRSRAEKLKMEFSASSPESRAIIWLCCLCKVEKPDMGADIKKSWMELSTEDQKALVKYLNTDGIAQKPAFILSDCSKFLENAIVNKEVGITAATRILRKVYAGAEKQFRGSIRDVV